MSPLLYASSMAATLLDLVVFWRVAEDEDEVVLDFFSMDLNEVVVVLDFFCTVWMVFFLLT